jgi:uncharacterized membrane protein
MRTNDRGALATVADVFFVVLQASCVACVNRTSAHQQHMLQVRKHVTLHMRQDSGPRATAGYLIMLSRAVVALLQWTSCSATQRQ